MAQIQPRLLTKNATTVDGTTHTTASVAPTTTGLPLYVAFGALYSAAPDTPTVAGTNAYSGTWTQIATVTRGSIRLTVFRSTAQSTVAGTITATYTNTMLTGAWSLVEVAALGSAVPVQSVTNSLATATFDFTASPLAAFTDSWNSMLMFVCRNHSGDQNVLESVGRAMGIGQTSTAVTEALSLRGFFYPGELVNPSSTGTAADVVGVAMELDHDGSGLSAGTPSTIALPTFRV